MKMIITFKPEPENEQLFYKIYHSDKLNLIPNSYALSEKSLFMEDKCILLHWNYKHNITHKIPVFNATQLQKELNSLKKRGFNEQDLPLPFTMYLNINTIFDYL